jgi:hypothetical protein
MPAADAAKQLLVAETEPASSLAALPAIPGLDVVRPAGGARLIAVSGWPLPTFCTASAANIRTVSTARTSAGVTPRGPHGARPTTRPA